MHHMDANETHGEKATGELYKNFACCFEQISEPYKKAAVQPLTSHLTNQPSTTNKTHGTVLEKQGRIYEWH